MLMLIWHVGPIGPFLEPEYFSAVGAQTTDIQDIVQENQSLRLSWLPVYAITLLLVGRRLPAICRAATWCPLVVALLGLAMVSALWSVSPADTLRRATALTCTSLLGLYLAVRFEPREFIRLFGWTLAVLMALSVVAAAGKPEIGISGQPHPGAWRGVFVTKNGLGQTMLMALVTFLVAA
ncbi:MAG: hypothetical protein ACM3W4_07685, partial [Ignavibacteriales bacterium]